MSNDYVQAIRKRHANLLLGYHGCVADSHLLGWIINEAAVLCPDGVKVIKIDDYFFIGSSVDWLKKFCNQDDKYFLEYCPWPAYSENMQASGAILTAFSPVTGTALDGVLTWSNLQDERDEKNLAILIKTIDCKRIIFFKSVEHS